MPSETKTFVAPVKTPMIRIPEIRPEQIGNEYSKDVEENIREVASNVYHVRGATPITEFNEFFGCELINDDVETVAGIIMGKIGHIPETGSRISLDEFEFKVLNADGRRINMFQVRKISRSR